MQSLIGSKSIEILKSMKYYRELQEAENSVNHCSARRWGHHTSDNNALTLRHGGQGKEYACLGLPDAYALERGQGNHTPSPGSKIRQGEGLWGPVQNCRECETVI
jgi:hypothetical protein